MGEVKSLQEKVESKIKQYFKIGYYDTPENKAVREAFEMFCEKETDNGYMQGIKRLLEWYGTDWKFELVNDELQQIKKELAELKEKIEKPKEEPRSVKTFG